MNNLALTYEDDANNSITDNEGQIEYVCKHISEIRESIRNYVNRSCQVERRDRYYTLPVIYPYRYNQSGGRHDCSFTDAALRPQKRIQREKMIARALCQIKDSTILQLENENGKVVDVGCFQDYEIPLFHTWTEDRGRNIDLVSTKGNSLYLIELKCNGSTETLFRCLIEAYTYYLFAKYSDRSVLRFKKNGCTENLWEAFGLTKNAKTIICPFVFKTSTAYREMQELKKGVRPKLKDFISTIKRLEGEEVFDVSFAVIDANKTTGIWPKDFKTEWLRAPNVSRC